MPVGFPHIFYRCTKGRCKNMQREEWKPVKGYEGKYEVSCCGNVRSVVTGKIKSFYHNQHGHNKVQLWKDNHAEGAYVHRLVYETFVGDIKDNHVIHHIDGNHTNNSIENLRMMKRGEHSSKHMKGQKHTLGHARPQKAIESQRRKMSIPVVQMSMNDEVIATYPSMKDASIATGVDDGSISKCCHNKLRTSGGFKWTLAKEMTR